MKISELCETCNHFVTDWDGLPFCALGMTIYDFDGSVCGEYERRLELHEQY